MSRRNFTAVVFFTIIAIFLIIAALKIHPFGDLSKINTEMDDYIIGEKNETGYPISGAPKETGADNTVTSVVFDYRGFDTLGEATVLFTAVAGVILIFRRLKK
jgi:hypothetical protein